MAAFESLRNLFEKPLPESPTLMESLSWNQIKAVKPPDDAAYTEIFGELHFEERRTPPVADSLRASFSPAGAAPGPDPAPSTTPWLPALDRVPALDGKDESLRRDREDPSRGSSPGTSGSGSDSFPSLDSLLGVSSSNQSSPGGKGAHFPKGHAESFQLCTEGLGFESSDDVEDSRSDSGGELRWQTKEAAAVDAAQGTPPLVGCDGCPRTFLERRQRTRVQFPPPITCIGSCGKPCVRFSSYREGGRFVLREVRLPHRELLHASRKDGRLKLHFVQADAETIEEEEEEDDDDDEEEEGEKGEGEEAEGCEEEEAAAAEQGEEREKRGSGGVD